MFRLIILVVLTSMELVSPSPAIIRSRIGPLGPNATELASHAHERMFERQAFAPITTCGYVDGDAQSPRTADPGYGCRVDTANGLWGFCPTSVISAKDCGLAGMCVDEHSCTAGCGRLSDRSDITTFSCEAKQFCSTVLLINGPDQSFEYIACGNKARTDSLLAVPNAVEATTTSASSTSSSISSVASTSPPANSAIQSTTPLTSSASILSDLPLPSSTSNPTAPASEQKSTSIGPIVGGVVGGLTVICLTILGVVLIRRKRGATEPTVQPPGYIYDPHDDLTHNAELSTHNSRYMQKGYQWDSSHGPVEISEGHAVNMVPAELPGKV